MIYIIFVADLKKKKKKEEKQVFVRVCKNWLQVGLELKKVLDDFGFEPESDIVSDSPWRYM